MDDTTQATWHGHLIDRPYDVPTHAVVKDHQWNATDKIAYAKTIWIWVDRTDIKTVTTHHWYIPKPQNNSKC